MYSHEKKPHFIEDLFIMFASYSHACHRLLLLSAFSKLAYKWRTNWRKEKGRRSFPTAPLLQTDCLHLPHGALLLFFVDVTVKIACHGKRGMPHQLF